MWTLAIGNHEHILGSFNLGGRLIVSDMLKCLRLHAFPSFPPSRILSLLFVHIQSCVSDKHVIEVPCASCNGSR